VELFIWKHHELCLIYGDGTSLRINSSNLTTECLKKLQKILSGQSTCHIHYCSPATSVTCND